MKSPISHDFDIFKCACSEQNLCDILRKGNQSGEGIYLAFNSTTLLHDEELDWTKPAHLETIVNNPLGFT